MYYKDNSMKIISKSYVAIIPLYFYFIQRHSVFVNSFNKFSSLTASKHNEKIPFRCNYNCKNTKRPSIKQLVPMNAFHLKILQSFLPLPSHYRQTSVSPNLLRRFDRSDYPDRVQKYIEWLTNVTNCLMHCSWYVWTQHWKAGRSE